MSTSPASTSVGAPLRPALGLRAGLASLILLSLGHFFVDLYSGSLGALQPLLVERLGLSLTQAGIVGGLFVIASSVVQPAYGWVSDRFHGRMLAAAGPAVAAICISLLGAAPTYGWLLALVALGGSGVAAFHPPAASGAALSGSSRRAGWMAVFISAGTFGFSLGPTYFTQILERLGVERMYLAAIPGVLVSVFLFHALPPSPRHAPQHRSGFVWETIRPVWKPFLILYLLVFVRSILQIVFAQFLPLYLHLERGFSLAQANYTLTVYLAAGALGGFVGGHLADRWGGRAVILLSMAGCLPFLAFFFYFPGPWSVAGLVAGGLILFFTIPVNVVMAQELAPSQTGTVSALMMGFAWGAAGMIFVPLTGWASDLLSLGEVLKLLLVFPVAGFALTLKLRSST